MFGIRYMWYMSSFYIVKMLCLCEGHGENET